MKPAIAFLGQGLRGYLCLKAVLSAGYPVPLAITADGHLGMSNLGAVSVSPEDTPAHILHASPDILVTAGYPYILSSHTLSIPTITSINLHAGPLPRYRGPHPLNWMLIRGETEGGVTIIETDQGIDTGPILAQESFPISPDATYNDLVRITCDLFPPMLLYVLDRLSYGNLGGTPQKLTDGFWCSRRFPSDGAIDFSSMSDTDVHNLVRALVLPLPGAFTTYNSSPLTIERTRLIQRTYIGPPGRILAHWPSGFVVACRNRGLLVTKLRDPSVPYPELYSTLGRTS